MGQTLPAPHCPSLRLLQPCPAFPIIPQWARPGRYLTKYMSVTGTSSSSEAWLAGSEAWLAVSTSIVAADVTMAQAEEAASLEGGRNDSPVSGLGNEASKAEPFARGELRCPTTMPRQAGPAVTVLSSMAVPAAAAVSPGKLLPHEVSLQHKLPQTK